MEISNSKGITLISVIISIIIMIVIASVALSNVVDNNSAIDRAENAVEKEEYRGKQAAMQQYLNKYNSKSFLGSDEFSEFLKSEVGLSTYEPENEEDKNNFSDYISQQFAYFSGNDNSFVVLPAEEGEFFYIKYNGETFGVKVESAMSTFAEMPENWKNIIDFVDWENDIIVTSDEKTFEANKSYAVIQNLELKDFSYNIPEGKTVTLKLLSDMTITNANLDIPRAAINLNKNSTLNLQVEGNVVVNSTFGQDADKMIAGNGGYAGIRVPKSATLNLSGDGKITCYGGDAGDGGTMYGISSSSLKDKSCAGGGGAGAGIGGNGGIGGAYKAGKGANGGEGESCGSINISGNLEVFAYGGAGGAGGKGSGNPTYTAGGAGGYPAAGIGGGGGGGAGGTCCVGAGGFSGGSGQNSYIQSENGLAGSGREAEKEKTGGSGYFQGSYGIDIANVNRVTTVFGGKGNQGWHEYKSHGSGDGGIAGSGGNITVKSTCKIYAYNGNLYSDGSSNQTCPIYLQAGIYPAKYTYICQGHDISYTRFLLSLQEIFTENSSVMSGYSNPKVSEKLNINSLLNVKNNPMDDVDMSKQGVGSGAGYIEKSNGTYNVVN